MRIADMPNTDAVHVRNAEVTRFTDGILARSVGRSFSREGTLWSRI